jgi:hypothetical protein
VIHSRACYICLTVQMPLWLILEIFNTLKNINWITRTAPLMLEDVFDRIIEASTVPDRFHCCSPTNLETCYERLDLNLVSIQVALR